MAKDNTFSGMAHNALTAETTIVGKIVSQKDIRIDGTLEGRLECQGKVVIGETGQVIGGYCCCECRSGRTYNR